MRAFARAYNITFFCVRARTRARKSHALLSSIRSIDDSGWKGGSSFLHRLLSFCFRDTNRAFLYLSSPHADWMNEKSWERTDKGGSSTESFDLRGRVSLLFCVLFFVVVLLHIFSLLYRRRSQRRHVEERAFFGKEFQPFIFWNGSLSTVGGVLYRLKSRVLSFFFGLQKHVTTQRLSSIHLRCSAYHDTRLSWDRSKKLW